MIEISFGKLLLLAVIALIVLGPEKLPVAARTAGTLLRRLRAGWDSVRAEVERELQVEEIRRAAREAAAQAEAAQAKLDQVQAQIGETARKAQSAAEAEVAELAGKPAPSPAADTDGGNETANEIANEIAKPGETLMTGPTADAAAPAPLHDEVPRGQA